MSQWKQGARSMPILKLTQPLEEQHFKQLHSRSLRTNSQGAKETRGMVVASSFAAPGGLINQLLPLVLNSNRLITKTADVIKIHDKL